MPIYLDYNATAPVRPEAIERMNEILLMPSNPSSVHSFGRRAKKILEDARKIIADYISAFSNEIIFTASGSEANNMALCGFPERRILVSAVEHSSSLSHRGRGGVGALYVPMVPGNAPLLTSPLRGEGIIPVDTNGIINLTVLEQMLFDQPPALVSIMLANNETGVIQPIAEAAALCRQHGALLHCDAVQGLGKIPVDFGLLGCDMMALSAHKFGGPVGAACLVVKQNLPIQPLIKGGGQELNRRAGTENIAAIAGFAKAVELIDLGQMEKVRGWLAALETGISSPWKGEEQGGGSVTGNLIESRPPPGLPLPGGGVDKLPNTCCIVMPGVSSEVQLMNFDLAGFAVSAGSACSSGRIEPSHVLAAMGVPEDMAKCAIRVSAGWQTTQNDIISFTEAWKETYKRLGRNS